MGTSSIIIVGNKKDTNKLTFWNWIPSVKEDQNPYRNELAGINGVLETLLIIIHYFNITQVEIEIALDGKSSLNTASDGDRLHCKQESFDILQDIHNKIDLLLLKIKWRWVEGHQDKKGKSLNWWVKKNQEVYTQAKAFLSLCCDHG